MAVDSGESVGRELAIEAVVAVITTGAGTAIGGPAGAIGGAAATPFLTEGFQRLADGVMAWRRQRGAEVFTGTAQELSLQEEELADRLLHNERLAELAGRTFLIAQDASLRAKRRALSAVLSNATQGDEAAIEHGLLLLPVLASIDAAHIRFLLAIEPADRRPESAGDEGVYGWHLSQVVEVDQTLKEVSLSLLQSLIAMGLVENATGGLTFLDSSKTWALSELGEELLALLREPSTS